MPFLRTRPFGCAQLEALFQHQLLHRSAGDLLRLLSMLLPLLLLLALFRVPQPDLALLWLSSSASFGLALALAMACSSPSAQHPLVSLCALWLCSLPLMLLPWPSLALLPSILAVFLLYAFFPFSLLSTGLICSGLSLAHFGAMFFVARAELGWAKLIASILAHIWAHLVGIYAFSTGRKIGRAVFLNANNAMERDGELQRELRKMANLLSGSLPPHIVQSVQNQLGGTEIPRVFVEHFGHCSVVFARLYGLPSILAQLQVPESAQLLNELEWRLRALAETSGLLLIPSPSESIVAIAGVPHTRSDHAAVACRFGTDLVALFHSFCQSTTAQIQIRVGIGSGSLSAGIIGSRRWHYEVLGMAVDAAMHLEGICPSGAVLISEDSWRHLAGQFAAERVAHGAWQISKMPESPSLSARPLLFQPPPRRFSLLTIQQAVLRLLQQQPPRASPMTAGPCVIAPATPFTKRKAAKHTRPVPRVGSCRQLDSLASPTASGLRPIRLLFVDLKLERNFHAQPDHWLIPGLAFSVLFLALFGLFQTLAMPRIWPNLATLGLALGLMFLLLLALYVNFLESFCQFITRTALGHSIAVLLVLAALCTCAFATMFSCPVEASLSPVCQPVQLPAISLALWMLLSSVFVRLSSLLLLLVLLSSLGLFCLHLFLTHPALYPDLLSRLDLLAGLFCLGLLLFLLARRNELLLRLDFLALLKAVEDGQRLERVEFLSDQILLNALPAHIAFNFAASSEPYAHICPSVGVLCARLGRPGDWVGEFGFDRLNRLVCEIDQKLGQLSERRIEKVKTGHCYFTASCGILPELAKNVNDAPCTIGEQLATLADLAEFIQQCCESEGLDIAIGLDYGTALSLVVGGNRPHYELLGQPVTRARKLADAASALGGGCVLLSEDVFLALRPRSQFHFDEKSALSVGPGLVAYSLLRPGPQAASAPSPEPLPPLPPPHRTNPGQKNGGDGVGNGQKKAPIFPRIRANPLADGRAISAISSSAQSLCSSELFSVDLSVETDSLELEWVTPEMVANGQYWPLHEPVQSYKGERGQFYSELSVADQNGDGARGRQRSGSRKRLIRGPSTAKKGGMSSKSRRSSGANTSAFGSEFSLPTGGGQFAMDRLNLAAKKVDRMLKEMAGIHGPDAPPECPFPRELEKGALNRTDTEAVAAMCRQSQCLSEYENGSRPSLACCSDSDAAFGSTSSRLDRLRKALLLGSSNRASRGRVRGRQGGDGNEADRSCSPSMASSQFLPSICRSKAQQQLPGARWRRNSAHSIGYEDEYELASAPLSSYSSSAVSLGWESKQLPSVGENALFTPIDADEGQAEEDWHGRRTEEAEMAGEEEKSNSLREKMLVELSRDICRNFGEFQLSTFADAEDRQK